MTNIEIPSHLQNETHYFLQTVSPSVTLSKTILSNITPRLQAVHPKAKQAFRLWHFLLTKQIKCVIILSREVIKHEKI